MHADKRPKGLTKVSHIFQILKLRNGAFDLLSWYTPREFLIVLACAHVYTGPHDKSVKRTKSLRMNSNCFALQSLSEQPLFAFLIDNRGAAAGGLGSLADEFGLDQVLEGGVEVGSPSDVICAPAFKFALGDTAAVCVQ